MSTRRQGHRTTHDPALPLRTRSRSRPAGRTLVRATLLVPPTLLVALLIAGPVSASGGPTPMAAAPHARSVSASRPAASSGIARDASSCAVVVYALSADPTAGATGEGQCVTPTDPSAVPAPAASSDPNTQAVTQSIGMEVRAGPSVP